MKNLLAALMLALAMFIAAAFLDHTFLDRNVAGNASRSNEPSAPLPPPPQPKEVSRTVSFMPGQYINIENRNFRKVEIHSQFPIRVASGDCHLDYGVEFVCEGEPADIFITDMRQRPIFTTPKGNLVTLTLIEY